MHGRKYTERDTKGHTLFRSKKDKKLRIHYVFHEWIQNNCK